MAAQLVEPLTGTGTAEGSAHSSVQRGLPPQVGVQGLAGTVGVTARGPVHEHLRTVRAVPGEGLGCPCRSQHPPLTAGHPGCHVAVKHGQRLVAVGLVDLIENRPHEALGRPPEHLLPAYRGEDAGHQIGWEGEGDVGADAVTTVGIASQVMGQPLGEPALHAPSRHGDDIRGEGVLGLLAQEPTQGIHEHIGSLGSVEVQHGPPGTGRRRPDAIRPSLALWSGSLGHSLPVGVSHRCGT